MSNEEDRSCAFTRVEIKLGRSFEGDDLGIQGEVRLIFKDQPLYAQCSLTQVNSF